MLKVLFDENVQRIFDSFATCFEVRMVFLSPDLHELKSGRNERNCRFCALLQQRLHLERECRTDDRAHAIISIASKRMESYTCHAGLTEAIMPVYTGTLLAGYIIIGQLRTTTRPPSSLLIAWQQHGGAREELEKAFAVLPFFTPERLRNMLNLFEMTVQYLASRQMIAVHQAELVEAVMEYLRSNLDRQITMTELTAYTGKSASTLTRAFKQAYGVSLKRVMITLKLDAADRYFAAQPDAPIAETAYALGFADPLYFSRLYKKYRQITPSERLRQLVEGGVVQPLM